MKAKLDIRVALPKLNLFRSRVENPSKELTSQIREILPKVVADTINQNALTIKAKIIEHVASMDLTYKSAAHKAKVMSVVEDFFTMVAAPTQAELNALVGDEPEAAEDADPEAADPAPTSGEEFED